MKITVRKRSEPRETLGNSDADMLELLEDNWDDMFEFSTQYYATYLAPKKEPFPLGAVKIGEQGLKGGEKVSDRRPTLPTTMDTLPDSCFSLGQGEEYYKNLKSLGSSKSTEILQALNDIVNSDHIYQKALKERVTKRSLMRFVPPNQILNDLRPIINNQQAIVNFNFTYQPKSAPGSRVPQLEFSLESNSNPPTNIHILIGRNGVGKTTLLRTMADDYLRHGLSGSDPYRDSDSRQGFHWPEGNSQAFTTVVSVSFSAFDTFFPHSEQSISGDGQQAASYEYVGLRRPLKRDKDQTASEWSGTEETGEIDGTEDYGAKKESFPSVVKNDKELAKEMSRAAQDCLHDLNKEMWLECLETLENDPTFKEWQLSDSVRNFEGDNYDDFRDAIEDVYEELSSGHKIVLLAITSLVATVKNRSLVLIDEPEAHLHPPLLSAYIRALSHLLGEREAMAILATHSPVALQEVPASCCWVLTRFGNSWRADRPRLETFAENVGQLTYEVFGLEVIKTGFHKILGQQVVAGMDFETIMEKFDSQIGLEGLSLIQSMIAIKNREDNPYADD